MRVSEGKPVPDPDANLLLKTPSQGLPQDKTRPYATVHKLIPFILTLFCGEKFLGNLRMFGLHFFLGFVNDLRMLLLLLLIDFFRVEQAIPKRKVQGIVVLRARRMPSLLASWESYE